eukprot:3158407-Amphidinium_carterae.1
MRQATNIVSSGDSWSHSATVCFPKVMLESLPVYKLTTRERESCVICCEPMLPGESVRCPCLLGGSKGEKRPTLNQCDGRLAHMGRLMTQGDLTREALALFARLSPMLHRQVARGQANVPSGPDDSTHTHTHTHCRNGRHTLTIHSTIYALVLSILLLMNRR